MAINVDLAQTDSVFVLMATPQAVTDVLGISAAGPGAGSLAASWQSAIGRVPKGSIFAALQSSAMGGTKLQVFASVA